MLDVIYVVMGANLLDVKTMDSALTKRSIFHIVMSKLIEANVKLLLLNKKLDL